MAGLQLLIKNRKRDPINLYLRFNIVIDEKKVDVTCPTGILVNKKWWSDKKQGFNSVLEDFDKENLKLRIENLKKFVIIEFNESYSSGESINQPWLERVVRKFNKSMDEGEANYKVYFVDFFKKYVSDSGGRINTKTGKAINKRTIRKYRTTIARITAFEEKESLKLRHKDINLEFHKKFVSFLKNDGKYGNSTVEKYISQIKMICKEAEINGYPISPEYKSRDFSFTRQKALDPFLNEDEIDLIKNLEIDDDELDKMRDLFIVGLHTGLRISDLKDFQRLKIVDDNILIASTVKTSSPAKIPIHPYVRQVLDKRNGKLPEFKLSPQSLEIKFNEKIKLICKKAGIVKKILGDKRDNKTNRDVRGIYPKYQLVSSHICRRSFVTNNYGKVPNQAIMAITTHSSEAQLLKYVKLSNEDHIEAVRAQWKKEQLQKSTLSVA